MLSDRWRASLPVVAAVVIVAALSLLTVSVMSSIGGDGEDRASVEVDGSTTSTTEATRRIAPRPTTTTTITSEEPEVLGESTERVQDGDQPAAPVTSPRPAPAPAPATPAPAPTTATTTTAPPAPPTTVCRNSTDASCGEFSWDPEPGEYEVEVYAVSTPVAARTGEPVTFAIEYVDPAGPDAEGACLNWFVTDPEVVNTSSCEVLATDCARTGPHDPPPPSRERILVEHTVEFQTPGEHEVTVSGNVATHLADGCESPYANTLTRTFTIVVS